MQSIPKWILEHVIEIKFITGSNLICCPRGKWPDLRRGQAPARNCADGNLFSLVVLTAVKPLSNRYLILTRNRPNQEVGKNASALNCLNNAYLYGRWLEQGKYNFRPEDTNVYPPSADNRYKRALNLHTPPNSWRRCKSRKAENRQRSYKDHKGQWWEKQRQTEDTMCQHEGNICKQLYVSHGHKLGKGYQTHHNKNYGKRLPHIALTPYVNNCTIASNLWHQARTLQPHGGQVLYQVQKPWWQINIAPWPQYFSTMTDKQAWHHGQDTMAPWPNTWHHSQTTAAPWPTNMGPKLTKATAASWPIKMAQWPKILRHHGQQIWDQSRQKSQHLWPIKMASGPNPYCPIYEDPGTMAQNLWNHGDKHGTMAYILWLHGWQTWHQRWEKKNCSPMAGHYFPNTTAPWTKCMAQWPKCCKTMATNMSLRPKTAAPWLINMARWLQTVAPWLRNMAPWPKHYSTIAENMAPGQHTVAPWPTSMAPQHTHCGTMADKHGIEAKPLRYYGWKHGTMAKTL